MVPCTCRDPVTCTVWFKDVTEDAVPCNEPVMPPVTLKEPVIWAPPESTMRPFFILVI
jgi:hypothetical protein